MEIRQLEYFVAVAEMGGFTRAAEVCHVVQTTVSHAVATLERELGVRLLDRTGRTVELTPEGRIFLDDAREASASAPFRMTFRPVSPWKRRMVSGKSF